MTPLTFSSQVLKSEYPDWSIVFACAIAFPILAGTDISALEIGPPSDNNVLVSMSNANVFDTISVSTPASLISLSPFQAVFEKHRANFPDLFQNALTLLKYAFGRQCVPKRCFVSCDDEFALVWETPRAYLNAGFWPDGSFVYYGKAGRKEVFGEYAWSGTDNLPEELQFMLRVLAS